MHKCHAEGCNRTIPEYLLMCGHHWRMVPLPIQQAVNIGWAIQRRKLEPVAGYLRAKAAAIEAVKEIEGGDT